MIEKMLKVTLAAVESDVKRISDELLWLGSVETFPLEDETGAVVSDTDVSSFLSEAERKRDKVAEAITYLSALSDKKKKTPKQSFDRASFEKIAETEDGLLRLCDTVTGSEKRKGEIKNKIAGCENDIVSLGVWKSLDIPLDTVETEKTAVLLGKLPLARGASQMEEVCETSGVEAAFEKISADAEGEYCMFVCLKEERDRLVEALRSYGFTAMRFDGFHGTAAAETERLRAEIAALSSESEKITSDETEKTASLPTLMALYDFLCAEIEKLKIREKLFGIGGVYILRGWLPERSRDALLSRLAGVDCYVDFAEPEEGDDVPIKLRNNRFASPFESILGLYSYPDYHGIDPTFIMSIFYFIIFGMIMQDVVYGIILILGAILLNKIMKPKKGAKKLIDALGICGISTIFFGVLFGGYLGNLPAAVAKNMFGVENFNIKAAIDPVADPMKYLYLSIGLGAVHLVCGLLIKAYMLIKRGKIFDAVFDVGSWLVVFTGIGLLFVRPDIGKWLALGGAAALVLTQGRAQKNIVMKFLMGLYSLYDSVSYLSDLLSYSRILALGLSGAVIGQVVNIIGTISGKHTAVSFIVLIFAVLLGHTLNFALSALGAFVHTARLQYIEFFNKFYEDGGREFVPAEIDAKYVEIEEDGSEKR